MKRKWHYAEIGYWLSIAGIVAVVIGEVVRGWRA